jgi:soluble lytic murein transglycosylase
MTKVTYLILGSCIAMQAAPVSRTQALIDKGLGGRAIASFSSGNVPHYAHAQAKELLGLDNAYSASSMDDEGRSVDHSVALALYVHHKTNEFLPQAFKEDSQEVAQSLIDTANRYEMDPLFLMALIRHESRFNPSAIGSHGEIGLMQIKPSTAAWLIETGNVIGYDVENVRELLKDPVTNIAFGTAYLAKLRETFKGRGPLYVSAYNMGAPNVKSRLRAGIRPRIYSDRVLSEYVALSIDFTAENALPRKTVASSNGSRTFDLY